MYTLIDGVQFYDKDEVDDLFAQNGSTSMSGRLDQEVIDRTAADDALGARIDQETQELSDKLTQEAQELSDKLTQESNVRLLGDQTISNQLAAIEQLWSTLIAANFIDTDSNAIVADDSGKSIRQIAHDEFYRQLVTDADDVKQQLDTLKELADYLQNNPTILTDIYTKLGLTWSLDTPTDFGAFDFSSVLTATDVDSAIVELHNTLVNKAGDLSQLTTTANTNLVAAINELDAEVGDLSTLSTVEKGTIVGAINSEFEWRRKNDETLGSRISDEVTDRMNADLLLDSRIGLLNSLKTTNKSSTVAAINEIYDTVQQNGGGGAGSVPTPTPSDGVDIISIALQSNVTGSGEYTETVDLTDLAECVTSNKPYLFEVTAKLPMANYTFKNCSATLIKGTHTTHFDINLLNDIITADAAKLAFTLNHDDATNTSVTFTMNDNVTIGGGGGGSGTGTDTAQLEAKLNAEITARTQADADLGARIDAKVGDLSTLSTVEKGTIVDAINEVNSKVGTGGGGDSASSTYRYTYVVDSDDALTAWANNDRSGGKDYTSVLIRNGEWTSSKGVNLTAAGTKVVVGEAGSQLVFNNVEKGLYYAKVPPGPDHYMRGVIVSVTASSGSATGYGFHSCTNLINCAGIGDATVSSADSVTGFHSCTNLTNCSGIGSGSVTGSGFYLCTNLTNCSGAGSGFGFHSCTNLTNCSGIGIGSDTNSGFGFYSCKTVVACKAGGHCTTAVFQNCYASSSENSAYACADTANGGFNNTTNPSR